MSDEAHEATPDHELERQIMSYNEAKNEREWWAMHEIERLREELYEIKLAAAGGEDAPGAANMVGAKDVERWTKELWRRVRDGETEIDRLREVLRVIANNKNYTSDMLARAALGEKE